MDDIDDLLDEVESKYCSDQLSVSKSIKDSKKPVKKAIVTTNQQDSLDDIINDIIADDGLDSVLNKKKTYNTTHTIVDTAVKNSKVKCSSVYVSGSFQRLGLSSSSTKQSICDQLHCTSCDNKIVTFENYKWSDSECDYLVFRNNYPDFTRLESKLLRRSGYRAYCCQCSWLSAKDVMELRSYRPDFKWVCRKH